MGNLPIPILLGEKREFREYHCKTVTSLDAIANDLMITAGATARLYCEVVA
jgi:hypothetical protein